VIEVARIRVGFASPPCGLRPLRGPKPQAYQINKPAFTKEEQALNNGIVNKLTAYFNRKELGRFEKWRVAAVLRDWMLQKPDSVPEDVYKTMSKIFETTNAIFGRTEPEEKHVDPPYFL